MFPDCPAVASRKLVWHELFPPVTSATLDRIQKNHDVFTLTVDVEKGVAVSSNSNLRWV